MLVTGLIFLAGGIFEPFSLNVYWTPDSLFDLNSFTGLDLESFLFGFGLGGIAPALPYILHGGTIVPCEYPRYRRYIPAILVAPWLPFSVAVFLVPGLWLYATLITLTVIAGLTVLIRRDLVRTMAVGSLLFAGMYIAALSIAFALAPGFIESWNMAALSGVLLLNVPVEEGVFALLYGAIAATSYKFLFGFRLAADKGAEIIPA